MIQIRWWVVLMLAVSGAALGLLAGTLLLDVAYEKGQKMALEQVRQEIAEAAHEGRPFYLVGSKVKLTASPRTYEIAGAGADVPIRKAARQ